MRYLVTLIIILSAWFTAANAQDVATASIVATQTPVKTFTMPVRLTAGDFITKIYGMFDPRLTRSQMIESSRALDLLPQEDEYGLWLETDNGYSVNYYGMTPEVSARAAYGDDEHVTDYGFFFLFPYAGGERDAANSRQAAFSGTLLQEMLDMGLTMEVDPVSDALFEVEGDYRQNNVDVRLVEEHDTDDGSGRFILILSVNPDSRADAVTAEN